VPIKAFNARIAIPIRTPVHLQIATVATRIIIITPLIPIIRLRGFRPPARIVIIPRDGIRQPGIMIANISLFIPDPIRANGHNVVIAMLPRVISQFLSVSIVMNTIRPKWMTNIKMCPDMFTRVALVTIAIPMAVKAVGISILLIIMPWISGEAEAQQQPLSPHGEGVGACQNCHIPQGWHKIVFNHSQTSFPLEGAHRSLRCQDCHNLQSFSNLSPECQTCHTNAHQGRFSQDCQRCHTSCNWLVLEMSVAHRGTIFIMGALMRNWIVSVAMNRGLRVDFKWLIGNVRIAT